MAAQHKRPASNDLEGGDNNAEYETLKKHDTKRRRENKKKKYQHILEGDEIPTKESVPEDDDDEEDTYGEEGDDYDRDYEIEEMAAKKEGIQLEPFNMKQELEEGSFDDYGNYVKKRDSSLDDPWYDAWQAEQDSKKEEGEGNADAERKAFQVARTKGTSNKSNKMEEDEPVPDMNQSKKTIVNILQPKETVLQGLRRLKPPVVRGKSSKGKEKTATVAEGNIDLFNKLTEAADNALARGYYNIYSDAREKIAGSIEEDTPSIPPATTTDSSASANEVMWEYKTEEDSKDTHGPFSTSAMISWRKEGYFQGESAVWVRRIGSDGANFYRSDRVDFEDYLDS